MIETAFINTKSWWGVACRQFFCLSHVDDACHPVKHSKLLIGGEFTLFDAVVLSVKKILKFMSAQVFYEHSPTLKPFQLQKNPIHHKHTPMKTYIIMIEWDMQSFSLFRSLKQNMFNIKPLTLSHLYEGRFYLKLLTMMTPKYLKLSTQPNKFFIQNMYSISNLFSTKFYSRSY